MSTATPTPLENMGAPLPRYDARAKVTGMATYASDFTVANPAHGYLLCSTIAKGRITAIDTSAALALPGVLHITTHENREKVADLKHMMQGGQGATADTPLSGPEIRHDGQIIGLIVADSYEIARHASHLVKVTYAEEAPSATMSHAGTTTDEAAKVSPEHKDPSVGDAEAALKTAKFVIDAEYETPTQHHNTMELYSTTAIWSGDELLLHEPSQWVAGLQFGLAQQLGMPKEKVRIVSPYVGGAFGSKASITHRTVLVAQAARLLGRPVKLVAPRDQGFTFATYRAETKHHVRLGADADGKLVAYAHEAWELTSRADNYLVGGTKVTSVMYGVPNISTKVHVVHADRNTPGFMRSPGEVPYMFALESAVDELAIMAGIDPVEFRRRNDTMKSPVTGAPYTSRSLMKCYDAASAAFGWASRNPKPASMRDGDWQIGYGCATACYPTQLNPSAARVKLNADGAARVEVAVHDVGTGAYTIIQQVVAERLGIDPSKVTVELGDSALPPGPVSGGSVTTASVSSVLMIACNAIRKRLFGEGELASAQTPTAEAYKTAFERIGTGAVEEYAEWAPKGSKPEALAGLHKGQVGIIGGAMEDRLMFAFGAEFVEVRVHALTGEIRVPRIIGAFAGGRIVNTRTANSQLMGGLIWGIGSALHEFTEIDESAARYFNDNIAEYLMPVNADITRADIILVPEIDTEVNPAGVKGIGELANVGTNAAVANAVYHATGKRFRQLPITLDKLVS